MAQRAAAVHSENLTSALTSVLTIALFVRGFEVRRGNLSFQGLQQVYTSSESGDLNPPPYVHVLQFAVAIQSHHQSPKVSLAARVGVHTQTTSDRWMVFTFNQSRCVRVVRATARFAIIPETKRSICLTTFRHHRRCEMSS